MSRQIVGNFRRCRKFRQTRNCAGCHLKLRWPTAWLCSAQRLMNLKQLMYFQGVAAHGCITTAAARANVAQSALSSQVAALEADLGVKLLIRHSRGVTLTRSGEVLLERA